MSDSTGAASVLAFDWGLASPTRRWPRVSRNVEQVRWWGDRLSRLDTTTWNWEPLAAAAEEGHQIVNLSLASGGAVVVAFASGVATLTGNTLSKIRPFGEFWAFSHITQDRRLVLAWQPSNTRCLVTSSGVKP